jgi:2-octaprenyl-6-methoxyphenol hydroxylase
MAESANRCDVLIGGGSFAGLALAIALKQALGPTYRVTVADPAFGQAADDARASAIVAAARRLFETIGVWDTVAGEAQPIVDMHITDSRLGDAVRPVFLTFHGDIEQSRQAHAGGVDLPAHEPFAHMVENKPLLAALVERAKLDGVELVAQGVTGQISAGSHILVALADGRTIAARLLVAADGARSGIRQRAGIATHGWDYGQSGIVTTVAHERDHGGRAEEHFLPGGPFAILPL